MSTFGARLRGIVSGMLGPTFGALPWIGDRPGVVGPSLGPTLGVLTPQAALSLTALFRCCTLLADSVSSQPPSIYTSDPQGGRVRQVGTAGARTLALLSQPDSEVFAFGAALSGNGFLRIKRDGTGAPSSLVGVPPWRVSMLIGEDNAIRYRIAADATVNEPEIVLPQDDMVHVRYRSIGANRYWGVPPSSTCSASLGLALASRDVQRVLFQNLSRPGGVLTAPGKIDPRVATEMQSRWDQNYAAGGAGKVAVLANGLTFAPLTWSAVDAQLLDQIKASVDDIGNAYGVPTNFLSTSQHLTHASSSEATKSLYVSALKPFTARCADALTRALLPRNDIANGAYVDFDLTSVLLPPSAEMATFIATLVNAGVLSPNDARNTYLNLPDIDGGDALRTPTQQPPKATP